MHNPLPFPCLSGPDQLLPRQVRRDAIAGLYDNMVAHVEDGRVPAAESAREVVGGGRVHGNVFAGALKEVTKGGGGAPGDRTQVIEQLRQQQAEGVRSTADALRLASLSAALPKDGLGSK